MGMLGQNLKNTFVSYATVTTQAKQYSVFIF